MFINGTGCISFQDTFGNNTAGAPNPISQGSSCIEPLYRDLIDSRILRRLSRILRMSYSAASFAVKDAGLESPDGIITGTSAGCVEDTEKFLFAMIKERESALSPTSFIQSTHNSISSAIALMCSCRGYNSTYSSRGFSFESALTDCLVGCGGTMRNILVGAADEITEFLGSATVKSGLCENVIPGEGAAYFLLSRDKGMNCRGKIISCDLHFNSSETPMTSGELSEVISRKKIMEGGIDLVISGGFMRGKLPADEVFGDVPVIDASVFFGEHFISSAFSLWTAVMTLSNGVIPFAQHRFDGKGCILVYNNCLDKYYSFIKVCDAL